MDFFNTFVFTTSVLAILYIIAGYPLLLARIAAHRARPVSKDAELRTVSFIIAVRNGEKFLAAKLRSIRELNYPRELIDIAVISDGSTDETDSIAQSFASDGVSFYRISPSGKPSAINLGIAHAKGEILILTDVRQKLHPDSLRNVVACFGDPSVGAVSGELSIHEGLSREEADTGLYWKYEVFIRKHMSRIDSTFGANGPFYAMRRSLAVHIPPDTLIDDVYLPLAAFFKGYRLVLEESAKAYDYPTNLNSEFKRKVRTQAGLYQILQQYPNLLSSSNRMRFHFISGKFARLLIPFFLILIALTTFGLPEPFRQIALAGQVAFYLLALVDSWLPQSATLKRLTSPIRTFVVLMAAALMGIQVFFVPPRKLWKETKVRVT
jgi:biofilm PGA synthesis N-glycosyltransferase PgaC